MTSHHNSVATTDNTYPSKMDRLAFSRAQHLQLKESRPKSISDDETDGALDWSDSDRECCPLSDFESISNNDETDRSRDFNYKSLDDNTIKNEISQKPSPSNMPLVSSDQLPVAEIPYSTIDDSTTSTRISFTSDMEKPKVQSAKTTPVNSMQLRRQPQTPLLPARHIPKNQMSSRGVSTSSAINAPLPYSLQNRKTTSKTPTRFYLHRENTSTIASLNTQLTKDSNVSSTYSFQSHDDNHNQRQMISPNFSQSSVPRAYEIKKIFIDDYDYGRLTDISSIRPSRPVSRQKWGTIVHPPFPLGYQHIAPNQITKVVERLANPARCRDRHTSIETPSKRYLSAEETDALVRSNFIFFSFNFLLLLDKSIK